MRKPVRRWLAYLLTILCLASLMTIAARAQGEGVIEGQVLNATSGGTPVAKVPVTLWLLEGEQQKALSLEATDEAGRFRFQALDTQGYSYVLEAEYLDVSYWSDVVTFSEGTELLSVPVNVYETTTSDADLWVERAHLILDFQAGTILVQEMHIFVNVGDKTYVGIRRGEETVTIAFSLPQGASGLRSMERVTETESGFAYTRPIPPGNKQFYFSYELPYPLKGTVPSPLKGTTLSDSASYTFSREVGYPIRHLDVLVADKGVEVTGQGLITQEPVSLRDRRYLHLSAEDLGRGDTLTLRLDKLPLEAQSGGVSMPGPNLLVRVVIGLGTLTVVLLLGYPFLKKRQGEES